MIFTRMVREHKEVKYVQLYLKPEGGPDLMFSVFDRTGKGACEVFGKIAPIGSFFVLRMSDGKTVARMKGVCLPSSIRYSAACGPRKIRFQVRPTAISHHSVRFKGVRWRFRGNLITRSFDILDDEKMNPAKTIMTHGRCWNCQRECYAITIPEEKDVPLALCVAVAIDSTVMSDFTFPVPAG